MAALSAKIRGASEIYVVDVVPERLEKVKHVGATPVNFTGGDPVEQIYALRAPQRKNVQDLQPGAGNKMPGVMCGIEARALTPHTSARRRDSRDESDGSHRPDRRVLSRRSRGRRRRRPARKAHDSVGNAWEKGLSVEMGQCPVKRYNVYLRDLIVAGVARPSFLVSHRIPIDDAPEAYRKFDKRVDGYTKVLLKPQQRAA